MIPWNDQIDPSTIPDSVLRSERARRNSALRKVHSGGKSGRPKKLVKCATCGEQFGVTEFRKHETPCVQAWVAYQLEVRTHTVECPSDQQIGEQHSDKESD